LVFNNGYAELSATDRIAFVSNPAFDASVLDVWGPLQTGGCLVVVDRVTVLDPSRFARTLAEQAVTVLSLTTGLFNRVAPLLASVFPRLRYLIIGGDVVDPRVLGRVWRDSRPRHFVNTYGPTETTLFATSYEVTDATEAARSVPIGRPIANTRIYVLDRYGEPVPLGAVGEVYIGGAGVALGYLNRPELTAERFVCDPFSRELGARMYRTGDLARYRPDGNLEFLGRNDHQVKVRGYRIELGEIEARLCEHPAVREAVVIAREDSAGDKRLVAYVTGAAAPGESDSDTPSGELVAALRRHLAEQLPEYMVPWAFVRLAALPLTPNGKLDRQALPAPGGDAVLARAYEAPQGELESTLAMVWAELLGVPRVGRHDHFFELGGHSLLAVRLQSRLQEAVGVELPLTTLFAQPTLVAQAEVVGRIRAHRGVEALPPIGRVSRAAPLALSFAQQRLWFLAQLGAGATYHMPMGLRLRGALDTDAFRRSLDGLVVRHEALRSVFVSIEGEPRAELLPETCGFALIEENLEHEPRAAERLAALCREEAEAPFDLTRGPLIRGRLLRLGPQEHVFL
ncbi:MAG TPA: AMP-binding protein, partial [Polyangiales bacterium]